MKTVKELIQENQDMIKERFSQLDRLELIQEVRTELERNHLQELDLMLEEINQALLREKE
jgi:hypothetical protein